MGRVKQLLQDKVDNIIGLYDAKKIDAKEARTRLKKIGLSDQDIDTTMQYMLFNYTEFEGA